jgi:diguanylate cyclase (GGDEF)-like protein/PAS domain S-box-containing protein
MNKTIQPHTDKPSEVEAVNELNTINQSNHYAAIIESSEDAIISKTLTGKIVTWNSAAEKIFGFGFAEMIGKQMSTLFPPELLQEEDLILSKIAKGERVKHYSTKRLTKLGNQVDLSVTISPIKNENGEIIGASKIARDISDTVSREKFIEKLLEEKSYFSSIVHSSDDAILSKSLNGDITSWNKSAENIFGFSEDEMVGQNISKLIPEDRLHEEMNILAKILRGEKIEHFQTVRLHKDGHQIDVSVTISPIIDQEGKVIGASKIARDISEKVAADQKLWEYANFDTLTNLPNRRLFLDRVNKAIAKATRDSSHFALMYMDLDHFKQVNDKFGHSYGDELLIIASKRISDCFRKSDTVARLGGDEFAALLPDIVEIDAINNISQKILEVLQQPFHLSDEKVSISVSIGIAIFPNNGNSIEDLINYSDFDMYRMKAIKKTN